MSKSASFNIFCDALKVSDKKKSIISLRYNSINKKLNKDFWDISTTYGGIYVGCYGRETANDGINEIDMIFEMPSHLQETYEKYKDNCQVRFLEDVRRSIASIYPRTTINKEKNTIKVKFSDGMSFNVLPAFIKDGGTYLYADISETGSWKTKRPISEIEIVKQGNMVTDDNLKKLCYMIKAWKENCNVKIKDVLIDTLAYEFLMSAKTKYNSYYHFDKMCVDFFKFLMEQDPTRTKWIAIGSGREIYNPDNFRYKAIIAHFKAESAVKLDLSNKKWTSRQKWREVFGYRFPESIEVESQLRRLLEKTNKIYNAQKECAHILNQKIKIFRGFQLFNAGMIISGILILEYTTNFNMGLLIFLISALIFVINLYFRKYNLKEISAKHMQSASNTFLISEEFNYLLKDLNNYNIDVCVIKEKKIQLQRKMMDVYQGTSRYVGKQYFNTAKELSKFSETNKEKNNIIDSSKVSIPIWQNNKFFIENQVQCLMNYRKKMI